MKKEIKLNVLGSFPADVRYWPQNFPHNTTEESKNPTLTMDGKPYQYDSTINLSGGSGTTLHCLEPVIADESLPRIVLKKVRVDYRSNKYSTKVAVAQFVLLYPQYWAAFGSFMGTQQIIEHGQRGMSSSKGIRFDISVLPYLGNDLAFLIEAKQLSTAEAESIAIKIILEFRRIKKQFPDFLHRNITAFNIIVSEDKQKIFFIDSQPRYAEFNNDLLQIVGICRKMMGGTLPETVTGLLSLSETLSLGLDNKKYQETKIVDVKWQPKADFKTFQPREVKFSARSRLRKLAVEVSGALFDSQLDSQHEKLNPLGLYIRISVLESIRNKIYYLEKNAETVQNWGNITISSIPEIITDPQLVSFSDRYNESIEKILQKVAETYINNKITFACSELEKLLTDLIIIKSSPFFGSFEPTFQKKMALELKKIDFIHATLDQEKKSNKNPSSSTQLVEDKKNETQFQIVPFAPTVPFTINEAIFNFLSWQHILQLRETSRRFRGGIDSTPLPRTIIILHNLQLIIDLREAKEVQRLPPIISQAIQAAKCNQSSLGRLNVKGYVDFYSKFKPFKSLMRARIVNNALEDAAKDNEEKARLTQRKRLSLG